MQPTVMCAFGVFVLCIFANTHFAFVYFRICILSICVLAYFTLAPLCIFCFSNGAIGALWVNEERNVECTRSFFYKKNKNIFLNNYLKIVTYLSIFASFWRRTIKRNCGHNWPCPALWHPEWCDKVASLMVGSVLTLIYYQATKLFTLHLAMYSTKLYFFSPKSHIIYSKTLFLLCSEQCRLRCKNDKFHVGPNLEVWSKDIIHSF